MKILYILHTTHLHGATKSFYLLVEALVKKGVLPIVVVPFQKRTNRMFIRDLKKLGCVVVKSIIVPSLFPKKDVLFFLKIVIIFCLKIMSFLQLLFITLYYRPLIIHTNVGIIHEGFFISKILNIKHVWHLREFQDLDFNWKIFPSKGVFKRYLKKTNSISISHNIFNHFSLSEAKSKIIYNPIISLKEISLINETHYKNYFFIASRISPEKGIEGIIKTFAKLSGKIDSQLLIAGNGKSDYVEYLKKLANSLGISKRVDFLGYRDDVYDLMKNSIALLVGSKFEAFGRMTAEAIMQGVFVIGKNTGGTKEIIQLTGGGSLYDQLDELEDIILEIYRNRKTSKYTKKLVEAQIKSLEYFSVESSSEAVFDFYKEIL